MENLSDKDRSELPMHTTEYNFMMHLITIALARQK